MTEQRSINLTKGRPVPLPCASSVLPSPNSTTYTTNPAQLQHRNGGKRFSKEKIYKLLRCISLAISRWSVRRAWHRTPRTQQFHFRFKPYIVLPSPKKVIFWNWIASETNQPYEDGSVICSVWLKSMKLHIISIQPSLQKNNGWKFATRKNILSCQNMWVCPQKPTQKIIREYRVYALAHGNWSPFGYFTSAAANLLADSGNYS